MKPTFSLETEMLAARYRQYPVAAEEHQPAKSPRTFSEVRKHVRARHQQKGFSSVQKAAGVHNKAPKRKAAYGS